MGTSFLWCLNWKFLCLGIFLKVVLTSLVQPCHPSISRYNLGCQCELRYQNCSLRDRYEGDTHFLCTVGRKAKWEQYKAKLQYVSKCEDLSCDPALITNLQSRVVTGSPFLNISFSVPIAFIKGGFDPGVILLNISVTDQNEMFQDQTFLHVGHRLRLFDFSRYQSTSDVQKRIISFPCILGFDRESIKSRYRVYSFNLTTFSKYGIRNAEHDVIPYTTITFNITIYNYYLRSKDWKTIMAVSHYPTSDDIYLVFEPAPVTYQVDEYQVTLLKCSAEFCNSSVSSVIIKHSSGRYIHTFSDVEDGKYKVKIIAKGPNCQRCTPYLSDIITVGSNLPQKRPIIRDDFLSKTLFSALGALIAVLLLIPGYVIYKRRRRVNTPATDKKILLVYSSFDREIAKYLVHYLRFNLCMDITYDQDDLGLVTQNVSSWYTKKIDSANCIVILWSPSSFTSTTTFNTDNPVQDFFQNAVGKVYHAKLNRVTDLKVASIYFSNVDINSIPADAKQMSKIFLMFNKFKGFYQYIYDSNPLPSDAKYLLKKEYKRSILYKEVVIWIKKPNTDTCTSSSRPNNSSSFQCDSEGSPVYNHDCPVHGTNSPTQDLYLPSTEDLEKEMLKLNMFSNPEEMPLVHYHSDETTESDDDFEKLDLFEKFLAVNNAS